MVAAIAAGILFVSAVACSPAKLRAQGEPAETFLNQLRAEGYFDMAVIYLDRLEQYPGVSGELLAASSLEKAQTYIDAAVASTDARKRDQNFKDAETQLRDFTSQGSHPRIAEARAQLGRLQMVRASQLMAGDPDVAGRQAARQSYLEAAKTFDAIVDELTAKLKEIQGQKIDDAKDPDAARRRDRYRAEFLQAKFDAAETRRLAAETYVDPAKDGEKLLNDAIERFTDLFDKYGQKYPIGAGALYYTGRCYELLGNPKNALDQFLLMLDQVDADPLRDAKFLALSGAIRMWLLQSPPNFEQGITQGKELLASVRRNEQSLPSVGELRVHVAKAHLAKAKDKDQSGPDKNNAQAEARKLLVTANKIAGPHLAEAKRLLSELGLDEAEVELPKAEPPKSLEDAIEKARQLLSVTTSLRQSLDVLEKKSNPSPDIKTGDGKHQETVVRIQRRGHCHSAWRTRHGDPWQRFPNGQRSTTAVDVHAVSGETIPRRRRRRKFLGSNVAGHRCRPARRVVGSQLTTTAAGRSSRGRQRGRDRPGGCARQVSDKDLAQQRGCESGTGRHGPLGAFEGPIRRGRPDDRKNAGRFRAGQVSETAGAIVVQRVGALAPRR